MRILLTIPNQSWVHKKIIKKITLLQEDKIHKVKIITPSHEPYENNLHHIVNYFMAGDYDFWLNIDTDNPPIDNPLDLIELDKDIIGLPTPIWYFKIILKNPIYWNVYKYVKGKDIYKEYFPQKGLQEVDAIGTGCFLISRRVFENKQMRKAPFERNLNKDGTVRKGNDIAFCEKARKQGFKIFAHFDYRCNHFKELNLFQVSQIFDNLKTIKKYD